MSAKKVPFVRASSSERVVASAVNWTQGTYNYLLFTSILWSELCQFRPRRCYPSRLLSQSRLDS